MDMTKPYDRLDKDDNPDYCRQDGKIFNWSESNYGYELAWWLTPTGDPIKDSEHVRAILKDRPFDKSWLESPASLRSSTE
jgi:hypothetical protein